VIFHENYIDLRHFYFKCWFLFRLKSFKNKKEAPQRRRGEWRRQAPSWKTEERLRKKWTTRSVPPCHQRQSWHLTPKWYPSPPFQVEHKLQLCYISYPCCNHPCRYRYIFQPAQFKNSRFITKITCNNSL